MLSESAESEHFQKALHSGVFKALELVESYLDLCNNKKMPKSIQCGGKVSTRQFCLSLMTQYVSLSNLRERYSTVNRRRNI